MLRTITQIFFACCVLTGCSYMAPENDEPGLRVSLIDNNSPQFVALDNNDERIIISSEKISDYRCPEGACCFSIGGYSVALLIQQNGRSVRVDLCNGECDGSVKEMDTKTFALNGRVYSISLIDLTPLPTLQNPEAQKTVVLELK